MSCARAKRRFAAASCRCGSRPVGRAPPVPPSPPGRPSAPATLSVTLKGSYPFEVVDGARVIGESGTEHTLTLAGPRVLRLRNSEYMLDYSVRVDASRTSAESPDLGRLTVRTPLETCNVWVAGRDLGYPPITDQKLAAGNLSRRGAVPGREQQGRDRDDRAGQLNHEGHPMSGSSCRRTLGLAGDARRACPSTAGAQAPATPDEFARRQYESGLEFLHAGKYTEALKDFEAVVDIYPASSVADEALLAIARYQLDVQRNPVAAQATAESLLKKFPASDSVAMSYVVAGQATVAKGLTPGNVDAALASFDRVQRLFAGTEAVAPALVAAGDTLRRLGRCPEALDEFDAVTHGVPARVVGGGRAAVECRVPGDAGASARRDAGAATCHPRRARRVLRRSRPAR